MKAYIYLFLAIIFEVLGTLLIPASKNFSKILPTAILSLSYFTSFYFLSFAVNKLPITVVYASWSGLGIFTIALLSYVFYKQTLAWQGILGLFFIVIGVTIVNIYKTP